MYIMTYRRRLHIFAIDKRNHLKIYMFGIVGETRAHDSFELIWSDNIAKVYNLLRYKSLCTCDLKMFNFHIKQTEISQKRRKETKNCNGCYFVVLRLLQMRKT